MLPLKLREIAAAIGAENEDCLFKNLGVRRIYHDDAAGNALDQVYALLAVLVSY